MRRRRERDVVMIQNISMYVNPFLVYKRYTQSRISASLTTQINLIRLLAEPWNPSPPHLTTSPRPVDGPTPMPKHLTTTRDHSDEAGRWPNPSATPLRITIKNGYLVALDVQHPDYY